MMNLLLPNRSAYRSSLCGRAPAMARSVLACLLAVLLCYALLRPTALFASSAAPAQSQSLVTREIRFQSAEAGEVFLVWGIDGWANVPEATRPPGTVVQKQVMYTPMERVNDTFVVTVRVPAGATIDYGFWISKKADGSAVDVWEANGAEDYHTIADQDGVTEVRSKLTLAQLQAPASASETVEEGSGLGLGGKLLWIDFWILLVLGLVFGIRRGFVRLHMPAARYLEFARSDIAALAAFVILTRALLLFVGYLSQASYSNPNADYIALDPKYGKQELIAFGRADASWYMDIARNGYEDRPFSLEKHANWAFYPLFPMILRAATFLFSDMIISGMVISTVLFLLSVIFLYKLILIDFDREIAMLTSTLAVIFPVSYFYSRPGPEALFLFLTVTSLFCARKSHWILAGILGSLATLSRLQGLLLLLPLLYIYYKQFRLSKTHNLGALSLLSMPAALILFMFYLYMLTGNMFASFDIQKVWDNNITYPFYSLVQFLSNPHIVHYYGFDLSLVSFLFVCSSIILTILMITDPRIPREYTIYTLLNMYLIVSRNTLTGSLRYMLPIFPLFLILALLIQNRKMAYNLVFFAFVSLQLFYFVSFVHQYNWAAN